MHTDPPFIPVSLHSCRFVLISQLPSFCVSLLLCAPVLCVYCPNVSVLNLSGHVHLTAAAITSLIMHRTTLQQITLLHIVRQQSHTAAVSDGIEDRCRCFLLLIYRSCCFVIILSAFVGLCVARFPGSVGPAPRILPGSHPLPIGSSHQDGKLTTHNAKQ